MKHLIAIFLLTALLLPCAAQDSPPDAPEDDFSDFEDESLLFFGDELLILGAEEKSQQIRSVGREEIERLNPADLPSLLERALGVSVNRSGSYGNEAKVSLRGMDGKRVAVLLDGVPVNSGQSGYFDLTKIDVNSVRSIEVVYGGADTKYNVSGAVGGVVNIITVGKDRSGYRVGAGISNQFALPDSYYLGYGGDKRRTGAEDLLDTQNAYVDLGLGNKDLYWTLNLSGNRAANHFVYRDDDGIKRRRTHNGVQDLGASSSLSVALPNYARLLISVYGYYGDKYIPGPMNSASVGREKDTFTKASVMLDADYVGSDKIDTELIFSHDYNEIDWEDPASADIHRLHAFDMVNRWGWYAGDRLLLRAGGDARLSVVESSALGRKRDLSGGLFFTAEASKGDLQLIPSVKTVARGDHVVPIPKLGLVYSPSDTLTLKNNYYRAFRFPAMNDLYWPAQAGFEGNPDLKSEDGFGSDFVVFYQKDKSFSLESSAYLTYHRDAISWRTEGGKWSPDNIGEAWYFGSDHSYKTDLNPAVKLTLNYAFLHTYVLTDELGWEDDRRIPYQPVHSFGLGVDFLWRTGTLALSGRYAGERFTTVDNVTRLSPYFTMDADLTQRMGNFAFLFSLKNAFGEDYSLVDGYPMPGTTVYTGLRVNYEKN